MNLKIVPLEKGLYDDWDRFCNENTGAWFWHTTKWIEYTLAYNPSLKSQCRSFLLYDDDEAIGIVPLILEEHKSMGENRREFSFGGGWLPSPLCRDNLSVSQKTEVYRVIFENIIKLAHDEGVTRIRFRSNPFNHVDRPCNDIVPPSVRFGFISYILPTQIIDVRKDPLDLMREMRKGHKSDIRRAEKFFHDFVLWREKDDQDLFFSYMKLHEKAAGRKTRPEETFAMMYSWIQEGNGALFGAELNGRPVSFAYVNLYKECAYYSSACNDPEIQNLPLAHFVQWSIIKWLHDNGYRYYEIGWQFFAPTPIFPASEKEIAISRFKRGFGGITVPIVFSERFITRRGFLNTIEERMLNFSGFQEEQPHFTQYYEKRIA